MVEIFLALLVYLEQALDGHKQRCVCGEREREKVVMESTVLSVGKSVLNGALGYAKSTFAEEVALQLGIQRDQAFIRDELEMMQSFLMAAHDERDDNMVVKTWVKQVRDVAYDVEDCLQDFAARLGKPSWRRIPLTLQDRRRVAKKMKELRANVEDVSQRNVRYRLIKSPGSKHTAAAGQSSSSLASATMFGIKESTKRQGYQDGGTDSTEAGSSTNAITAVSNEYQHIGRANEKKEIIKLVSNKNSQQLEVISVWGMGGLGKTTLVQDVYRSQEVSGMFEKRACVTVLRPFNLEDLRMSLAMQLDPNSSGNKESTGLMGDKTKQEAQHSLADLLQGKKYLIVLDDLSSTTEWDEIVQLLPRTAASCIIVTTREENIARHCSKEGGNIRKLSSLGHDDARLLFTKTVFKETVDFKEQYHELAEEAELILKKCNGLPLAIVTIGGFLANQPKTAVEWRKLNEHISAELEMNPELETITTVLVKSYDGLPYHLKTCFLYLSIFPEGCKVNWRRLVRRWIAEGYSREMRGKSAEKIADSYFMELKSRSMILPSQQSIHSRKRIDSCQVHDLIREIGISKSMEENLVFRLEEGCSSSSQGTFRHLAITSSSWEGDKSEFESIIDLSRVRSLTVFGEWRPFFISDKMRVLRVLDLEDTEGLRDHHLEHIGKLLHLRYVSLRGCGIIFHLPDSLGNLRQLETLDIRGTNIINLPKSIIKLRKLSYLRAGDKPKDEDKSYEGIGEFVPKLIRRNRLCLLTLGLVMLCALCSAALFSDLDGMSTHDICTASCCTLLPVAAMRLDMHGVLVPRGMRKLKSLHTLGVVNVARGKAVLQDIERLTQLRKLGVTGVNKASAQDLCSAIAALSRLESLLVRSEGKPGLAGCLDGMSSPPKNLQSLKLYGNLVKLPGWIQGLQNLVKLKLRSTRISENGAAMQVLGKLPNLAILLLWQKSFQGEELRFQNDGFRRLAMLELAELEDIKSVNFDQGATPKLGLLLVWDFWRENEIEISGLEFLPSIKEVRLDVRFALKSDCSKTREARLEEARKEAKLKQDKLNDHVRAQLAKNPKQQIVKVD